MHICLNVQTFSQEVRIVPFRTQATVLNPTELTGIRPRVMRTLDKSVLVLLGEFGRLQSTIIVQSRVQTAKKVDTLCVVARSISLVVPAHPTRRSL